ncbi:MAG: hypothetical protein KME32_22260 [Mojavia pulchra JT2-VF2]|jgi:hypothetical protein|uniref:Uncharacterized protein n=1 Tax=Mojavia pulchra JT2-VF2 TaxID=287848 RepID=A0A951Q1T7_9NOST|nr:hypothetical protein [Mojavia pulchra JT2-VF2]
MKLPQLIVTTVAAIAFGYVGSQYFNKNIMYAMGAGMVGLGTAAYLTPSKSKEKPIHTQPKQSA